MGGDPLTPGARRAPRIRGRELLLSLLAVVGCGGPVSYPGGLVPAALAPGVPHGTPAEEPVVLAPEDAEILPGGVSLIRRERAVPSPLFEFEDESGVRHTPESLHGSVVRLELWAAWCATCRAEFPHLQRQHEQWADEGLVVLAVCRNSKRAEYEQAVRKTWITFATADAGDGSDFPFPIGAFPTSVLLDRDGRVRAFWQGWRPPDVVDGLVRRLLEEPAAGGIGS